jgi:hypothetical protein
MRLKEEDSSSIGDPIVLNDGGNVVSAENAVSTNGSMSKPIDKIGLRTSITARASPKTEMIDTPSKIDTPSSIRKRSATESPKVTKNSKSNSNLKPRLVLLSSGLAIDVDSSPANMASSKEYIECSSPAQRKATVSSLPTQEPRINFYLTIMAVAVCVLAIYAGLIYTSSKISVDENGIEHYREQSQWHFQQYKTHHSELMTVWKYYCGKETKEHPIK